MRVLLVSNLYPPYWVGGYEQIAAWVAAGLRERGHCVRVLTGAGPAFGGCDDVAPELDLDLARVQETYFGAGPLVGDGLREGVRRHVFSRRNFEACLRAIDRFRPDLLSFWNPALVTFSPLLAARIAGVPSVVHLSDTVANVFRNPHPPRFPGALRGLGRRAVDGLIGLSRPDRVLVPSAFLREKLLRSEGLAPERVVVLRWPVEPTVSRLPPPPPRTGFERLLFVGTLIPEKGVDVLLSAFREASRRRPGLRLTLVGTGPAPMLARLREAAPGPDVQFLGRCDRARVVEAYREHDVLVFPSVWDEPFAVVPLEAMAMGLAVVASSAGGTPEAIEDGRTGRLVPPGDAEALAEAILELADHPSLAAQMAAAGMAWAREQQGYDVFVDRLEALYRQRLGRAA